MGGLPRQLAGVFLQLRQIVKRIGAAQFTSVDEAHEEIADLCAIQRLIEQTILSVR